ncbi:RNA polymerase sigma factor [Streptomyces cylindrosporus]|uniref:Sigma-70 family RNA polymerase sigma factor n=1 Tax=Streptomyces cylindrosporus TaxID=2927583 RepID=A0ABS9Y2Q5_9ACTN|nr:sigma-70 family RNA polymerase sigma factor [Streptomyces cylindrosporus]MCI3271493.1 sigma-70 family RNA polymerase sigma factor [Streptomyces cylindrosporus]
MPEDGTPDAEHRLRALYAAHYGRVLNFARRRAADPDAAQDAAAETFLVAWRRIDKVPREAEEALPWLYAVARNILANQARGERRGGRLAVRLGRTAPVAAAAPDHAGGVVEALHVRAALAALSQRDQETLRLIGWDGLDTAAAARVVGCSARAFAVRLHRARRRLERELARREEPAEPQLAGAKGERS